MAQFPDLKPVLTGLRWAIVGGVATRLYMPERVTLDLNIVVSLEDREGVRRRLTEAGFQHKCDLSAGGSSWTVPDGSSLDVVEMEALWLDDALAEAQHNLDDSGAPVLALAYLVLMKFLAGRVQDLADVTRMLGQADGETLAAVRQVFREHLPDDIDDSESIIVLGQMEVNPP